MHRWYLSVVLGLILYKSLSMITPFSFPILHENALMFQLLHRLTVVLVRADCSSRSSVLATPPST